MEKLEREDGNSKAYKINPIDMKEEWRKGG